MTKSEKRPPGFRVFHILAMIFVMTLLVSNTIAVKVVAIAGLVLPAGIICFPVSYIFGDILTEVYGYQKTRSVIWSGFICLFLMSLFYFLATMLPAAPFWKEQEAFAKIFGFVPRIVFASFLAYLAGSFLNSIIMSVMKVKMGGKHLWMRTIGSTIIGEGADSIIFNIVAFVGVFGFSDILFIMFSGFVLKTAYEIIITPVTYMIVAYLKKIEEEDKFDDGISYQIFKM